MKNKLTRRGFISATSLACAGLAMGLPKISDASGFTTGYVFDENLKIDLNNRGLNYWDTYLQEIFELLGLRGRILTLAELADIDKLRELKTLVLGCQSGTKLTSQMKSTLEEWVSAGGLLIGFAIGGMDEVFGIKSESYINQQPDDYTISGYLELRPHPLTHEIHPVLLSEQKLLILSDIQLVVPKTGTSLAELYDTHDDDLKKSAIIWNQYGKGNTGYFSFDVCKTVWLLHQGKPVIKTPDGEPFSRTAHLQVEGQNSRKIPYADEIVFIIQNMVAWNSQPLIYQIPPQGETIPDALFFWGGDCCATSGKDILNASNWMKDKGLPYHVNVIDLNLEKEDAKRILENGHEISLHYNFADGAKLTLENLKEQNNLFYKEYGVRPLCTVNHCLCWEGWTEPAKWMSASEGIADNSFISANLSLYHPSANGPFFGFGFGTSYPFYFYDDYRGLNKRLDFLEEPITCYEIGHRGSAGDAETRAAEEVHEAVDLAIKNHLTMNMFYHALYIARFPHCREAIEEILRYIDWRKANVIHMANDQLAKWWESRSRSTLSDVKFQPDAVSFQSCCEYEQGMIVKMLLKRSLLGVVCDGKICTAYKMKKEFAGDWLYMVVPKGKHDIKVKFE